MLLNTYNKREQSDKERAAGKRPSISRGMTSTG